MPQIELQDYDAARHPNHMQWFDDTQRKRFEKAPTLVPYRVCLVSVQGFTFIFHSVEQVQLALDYYSRSTHPSSRLPSSSVYGGDHWEFQRWYDKLPQFLLDSHSRPRVVAALQRAIAEYSLLPGARTGVEMRPYHETY